MSTNESGIGAILAFCSFLSQITHQKGPEIAVGCIYSHTKITVFIY